MPRQTPKDHLPVLLPRTRSLYATAKLLTDKVPITSTLGGNRGHWDDGGLDRGHRDEEDTRMTVDGMDDTGMIVDGIEDIDLVGI